MSKQKFTLILIVGLLAALLLTPTASAYVDNGAMDNNGAASFAQSDSDAQLVDKAAPASDEQDINDAVSSPVSGVYTMQ